MKFLLYAFGLYLLVTLAITVFRRLRVAYQYRNAAVDTFLACPHCFQHGTLRTLPFDNAVGFSSEERAAIARGTAMVNEKSVEAGGLVVRALCSACDRRTFT